MAADGNHTRIPRLVQRVVRGPPDRAAASDEAEGGAGDCRRSRASAQLGLATLGAGDIEAAIGWLREGAEVERDPNFVLSNVYTFFRHLHGEPGFRALVVDTMGLSLSWFASPDSVPTPLPSGPPMRA